MLSDRDDPAGPLIGELLDTAGADVTLTASSPEAARAVAGDRPPTLVVAASDRSIVAELRGSASRRQRAAAGVVLVDGDADADAALRGGADSVLIRPVESERLVEAIVRLA